MKARLAIIAAVAVALAPPAMAQNVEDIMGYQGLMAMKPPVTDADITDHPYRVLGQIETTVRKTTVFDKRPSRQKVFKELWERAEKLGADAVIKARYASEDADQNSSWLPQGTSIGARATGLAVKFLTDAEIAALPKPAPKP